MSRALYVDPSRLRPGTVALDRDDAHYLRRVLRLEVGASLALFDGEGRRAEATVAALRADGAEVACGAIECRERPGPAVHLALAVVKGERMDWAIQKLAELGVATIAPMHTERTVARVPEARLEKRRQRYESIARAAARQSENLFVPRIRAPAPLPEVLDALPVRAARIICVARSGMGFAEVLARAPGAREVAIAIGPEGGFTPAEVTAAEQRGFLAAHLGPQVLRVETAAIAASVLGTHLTAAGWTPADPVSRGSD